jgi:hypothetical protein
MLENTSKALKHQHNLNKSINEYNGKMPPQKITNLYKIILKSANGKYHLLQDKLN